VKLHEGQHTPLLSRLLRLLGSLVPLLAVAAVSAMVTYTILTAGGARQGSSGHWAGSSSAHSVHPLSFSTAATHTTQPTVWERKPGHEQHGGGLGGLFHHHNSSSSSTCRPRCKLRVALVNDAPYHLEIVAGYMQILGPLSDRIELVWYQAPQITPDGNYTPVRLLEMQGFTQLLEYLPNMRVTTDKPAPCDFAIFISPEYFEHKTKVGRLGSKHCWLMRVPAAGLVEGMRMRMRMYVPAAAVALCEDGNHLMWVQGGGGWSGQVGCLAADCLPPASLLARSCYQLAL
jgi:hypothetical protein